MPVSTIEHVLHPFSYMTLSHSLQSTGLYQTETSPNILPTPPGLDRIDPSPSKVHLCVILKELTPRPSLHWAGGITLIAFNIINKIIWAKIQEQRQRREWAINL